MKLSGIDHFVLTTNDLEACLHFYGDILNMTHELAGEQHYLCFGNQKINLHTRVGEFPPYARHATAGSQDFCLIATGDIVEIEEELEEKGCQIVEGIVRREGAMGHMNSIYLHDPDGNLVEIAVYEE